ncbi:unnamed protein product [Ambrosiozyma monospora]|uniref:Unnamed protein product n=1 Tax=Ambrosiozyma monospora TaxID=43982 RepID=A0A9W7DGX0_AMBMO|nr:unnamed protein product [Ambrosiozyma monospora]
MGLSSEASNAIIYCSYGLMLIFGTCIALYKTKFQNTDKTFLSSNGTKKGVPLALNFIASGKYQSTGCIILENVQFLYDNLQM